MSRALTRLLLMAAMATMLPGCVMTEPAPIVDSEVVESPAEAVQRWLLRHGEVAAITPDEAVKKLVEIERPTDEDALFYYGLLNQQLQSYGAWVLARDAFSELEKRQQLFPGQRQLTLIMREYNQNRINSYLRVRDLIRESAQLQQELRSTEEQRLLLEQKIQALTELEADISTRREE